MWEMFEWDDMRKRKGDVNGGQEIWFIYEELEWWCSPMSVCLPIYSTGVWAII